MNIRDSRGMLKGVVIFLIFYLVSCDDGVEPGLDPDPMDQVSEVVLNTSQGDSLVVGKTGILGDDSFGDISFRTHCGICHSGNDGFDLAFFDFSDHDIIRRGAAHVDTATVLAIRDYIRSIQEGITTVDRETELFRSDQARPSSDMEFAVTLFGSDKWPRNLKVEELQSVDPHNIGLSIPFPTWSSESTELDWMPEVPLPASILDDQGGLVRSSLSLYYNTRSEDALRQLIDDFERIANQTGFPCEGTPGFHPYPEECFEARRWMSSLTATFLIRHGITQRVPEYIADLWWRVGEAAVSWSLGPGNPGSQFVSNRRRRIANSWLTISWINDPARVGDNPAYYSEFAKHIDQRRQVALAYAYWLTTDPEAIDGTQIYDVMLQMIGVPDRLPVHWYHDYSNWMLDVVNGFIDQGTIPKSEEAIDQVIAFIDLTIDGIPIEGPNSDFSVLRNRLQTLRERVEGLR